MQTQPTTESTKQKRRVQRRVLSTESAKSEVLSPCDDLQARIAKQAYQLYLERGADHGHALNNWLQAEREILGAERTA